MSISEKTGFARLQSYFGVVFGLGPAATLSIVILTVLVLGSSIFYFFHAAPPDTLIISTGPVGTQFHSNAVRFQRAIAKQGVKLEILNSQGSSENLRRLSDPKIKVDIAFITSGASRGTNYAINAKPETNFSSLVSLGAIYVEPIQIYYNDAETTFISGFKGKRIAVGLSGSGTYRLAMTLLSANGIEPGGDTRLVNLEGEDAAKALLEDRIDVAMLMGDSASSATMRKLRFAKNIRLYNFAQADGYVRRAPYLHRLEVPQGTWDFGKNVPDRTLTLIGPSVDLVARNALHPALNDLLLDAAKELYGGPGIYRKRGEFPAAVEGDFTVSRDAADYYKSGKSFLYRILPFWLASMLNRILIGIVPIVIVLIPGIQVIPRLFKLRIELRIQRWYRAIMQLESDMLKFPGDETRPMHLERLTHIESAVDQLKMPASFAGQFYNLREHISFVHRRLMGLAAYGGKVEKQ